MNNWEWKKLGDVCDIYQPQTISAKELVENGKYLVYGANGVIGRYDKYNHNDSEILLTCRGATCGSINVSEPFSWINGNAMVVHPKNDSITKSYLKLTLALLDFSHIITGTAQPQITRTSLSPAIIPIPPLAEQNRIVKTLDDKFVKIDKLKIAAETNLKKAGAIFDAELKKEFNNKKWDSKKLNDLCELISGYAFDSKGYSSKNEDTLLVCGDNIMHCSFRWETVKRWPKEKCYELKRFELKDSDIVLAMDRPWIKSGLKISKITGNELPSLLVQRTAALRTTSHVSSDYLYYALQEKKFSDYLIDQQTGSGVPHISGKQILNFQIPLPPLSVQKEIIARLDKLSEDVKRLEANYKQIIADCDELKESILKKTFEGDSRSSRE